MGPLLIPLLITGATLASKFVSGYMQTKENEKNRKEARKLADVQRADQKLSQQRSLGLAKRDQALTDKKLSFQNQMTNEGIAEQETQKSYLLKKSTDEMRQESANKLFSPSDSYFTARNRALGKI